MPPPRKTKGAVPLKLFILDAHGGYAGECAVDEDCVVEYDDVLRAVPDAGLRDQQSVYLGENVATAFHGDRMSLIAISKGSLSPDDLAWVKATLTAAEAHLAEAAATPEPGPAPDAAHPAALETLAAQLDERETRLVARETAVQEAEARAQAAGDGAAESASAELQALRAQLEGRAERAEVERVVRIPAAGEPRPDDDELRAQLERDRKMLQRRGLDLLEREEKLQARELEVSADAEYTERLRKENEALRADLGKAQGAAPAPADLEAVKRDLDTRAKALQQRGADLAKREERLKKREAALDSVAAE